MPRGRSNVVCRITQSIAMLKSNADIGYACLTPVFTPKLDLLFPTSHSALEVVVEALGDKDGLL